MPRTYLLPLALFLLIGVSTGIRAENWTAQDFTVEVGTIVSKQGGLTLQATEQGQVLIEIASPSVTLSNDQRAYLSFQGAPPQRIYLIWRRTDSSQLFQHGFATNGDAQQKLALSNVAGWQGNSQTLQVGFLMPPGTRVTLDEIRLATPGPQEVITDALQNWSDFRPWTARDINVLPGTRTFNEGPYPVQVFAIGTIALLLAYVIFRRRNSTWTGIAIIILCNWIALDAFWQWRLWQQVNLTRATYAGLEGDEKALVSEDQVIVNLANRARRAINNTDAKVFIASQSDSDAMRAAYYLSPMNTYWHRWGVEIPDSKYLKPGDYILIVKPSAILYNQGQGLIRLPPGEEINVTQRYGNDIGLLLEVTP